MNKCYLFPYTYCICMKGIFCVLLHQVALSVSCPLADTTSDIPVHLIWTWEVWFISSSTSIVDVELEGHNRNISRNVQTFIEQIYATCMQMFTELTQLHRTSYLLCVDWWIAPHTVTKSLSKRFTVSQNYSCLRLT